MKLDERPDWLQVTLEGRTARAWQARTRSLASTAVVLAGSGVGCAVAWAIGFELVSALMCGMVGCGLAAFPALLAGAATSELRLDNRQIRWVVTRWGRVMDEGAVELAEIAEVTPVQGDTDSEWTLRCRLAREGGAGPIRELALPRTSQQDAEWLAAWIVEHAAAAEPTPALTAEELAARARVQELVGSREPEGGLMGVLGLEVDGSTIGNAA